MKSCFRTTMAFLLTLALPLGAAEPSAAALGRLARRAERAGSVAEAVLLYTQAASQAPGNVQYAAKAKELKGRLLRQGEAAAPAALPTLPAAPTKPSAEPFGSVVTDRDLREARALLPPPLLTLPAGAFAFDANRDARALWAEVGQKLGLTVLFDAEYPAAGDKAVRFQVSEMDASNTLRALSAATGSFAVNVTVRQILVVKDTTQKRQEREPTVAVVLSLPDPVSVQELQELARAVQQTMEIQKFAIDNTRRMVMMRDRVSKVRPAQHLFEQLLGARPAVVVDLELYEINGTGSKNYGVGLPTSTRIYQLGNLLNSKAQTPAGAFATFAGGASLMGLGLGDATVTATMVKSYAATMQRATVQTISGQPAQLVVGEKYPILTSGYFGDTSGTTGTVYRPPPSFQFENLGIQLKVTPFVHGEDEMTLEVEAEFKLLAGTALNGIPILSNRKFTSRVRMRNGEWAVLSGLSRTADSINRSGIPGLMQIPWLGRLLRTNSLEHTQTDVLILLKPRLLGLAPDDSQTHYIFLGPEGRPAMPL